MTVWVAAAARFWRVTQEQYRELLALRAAGEYLSASDIVERFDLTPRTVSLVPRRYRYAPGTISGAPYDFDVMTPAAAQGHLDQLDEQQQTS